MVDIDTSELRRLAVEIAATAPRVNAALGRVVGDTAEDAFTRSQQLVPVLTGELRASGRVERTGQLSASIVYDAEHAEYVEYGTSDTAPQPYVNPIADPAEEQLTDGVYAAVRRLL